MSEDQSNAPADNKTESQDDSIGAVVKRLGPAAWLGIAWTVFPIIGGFTLLANMKPISEYLVGESEAGSGHFVMGMGLYVLIFVLSAGFGFLPTYSQSILAGYAFGVSWGFVGAITGFAGASLMGYFIAGRIARKRVEEEIHAHPKAEIIRDALLGGSKLRMLGILTLIRIPPSSPFSLTNYAMSVCGVPKLFFLVATVVGMAPRSFAAVYIGSQVQDLATKPDKPKWLFITGIVLTFVVIFIVGKIANKALERVTNTENGS